MAGGLMILNPRKSRRARRSSSHRRRRKMTAKQLRYFGPRRRSSSSRKSRRAAPVEAVVFKNPRRGSVKKRRRHRHRRRRAFASNPRRRFRRNPIGSTQGFLSETFAPAAIGAAGAVGADLLLGMLPVPMFWQSGPGTQTLMRILASLGVGWVVGAIATEKAGAEAAAGGIVVSLYSLFKPWAMQNLPFRMARYVPLGRMGARRRRMRGMRRYVPMGALPPGMPRRGKMGMKGLRAYVSPARNVRPMGRALARFAAHQG